MKRAALELLVAWSVGAIIAILSVAWFVTMTEIRRWQAARARRKRERGRGGFVRINQDARPSFGNEPAGVTKSGR